MPDGLPDLTYQPAVRGRFAPLLMISGPSGTGKTYSALRLATGMAGGGKICFADTDNSRGRLYADKFKFDHLDLREPFRPMLFEQAALAAQKQGAAVLIIDNFAAEWVGPGGILEWFEEELTRMAGDNFQRREALKMVTWGRVKPPHKHMFQRLYRLNMAIILCCAAERKVAMVKQTEGKDKGKVIPVDQGFQPLGDKDAAYAMTASLLLQDVNNPGVPTPIKALLPDLQPIIHLDRPLDEETGARIAAWARGDTGDTPSQKKTPAPVSSDRASAEVVETSSSVGERVEPDLDTETPPDNPPPPPDDDIPPPDDDPQHEPPPRSPRRPTEDEIAAGAQALIALFEATTDRAQHLAVVDNADNRRRLEWLKKNRRELHGMVDAAVKNSWKRTDPKNVAEAEQQGDLIP